MRLLPLLALPACAVNADREHTGPGQNEAAQTDTGQEQEGRSEDRSEDRLLVRANEPLSGCAAAGERVNRYEAVPSRGSEPPGLDAWEDNMVSYGKELGRALTSNEGYQQKLNMQYYDAQWVFLQIADYTGETDPWHRYAEAAEEVYKHYLKDNDFGAAGYMVFPHGLYMDWKRNGDRESRRYLLKLRDQHAFARPEDPAYKRRWADARYSREVAYGLQAQILAERAGGPPQPERVRAYVDMALDHVDTWLTGDFRHDEADWQFCQAFMVGLTAKALIDHDEHRAAIGRGRDPRIESRLESLADWLWRTMWIPGVGGDGADWYAHGGSKLGAFEYVQPKVDGIGSETPAPDLNMLIAPLYGWLYERTGDERFRDRGDAIFAGGVGLAALSHGKPFNQHYRSSFDYIIWRRNGTEVEDQTDDGDREQPETPTTTTASAD